VVVLSLCTHEELDQIIWSRAAPLGLKMRIYCGRVHPISRGWNSRVTNKLGEANPDTCNSIERVSAVVLAG
jgi:hypothetical protein